MAMHDFFKTMLIRLGLLKPEPPKLTADNFKLPLQSEIRDARDMVPELNNNLAEALASKSVRYNNIRGLMIKKNVSVENFFKDPDYPSFAETWKALVLETKALWAVRNAHMKQLQELTERALAYFNFKKLPEELVTRLRGELPTKIWRFPGGYQGLLTQLRAAIEENVYRANTEPLKVLLARLPISDEEAGSVLELAGSSPGDIFEQEAVELEPKRLETERRRAAQRAAERQAAEQRAAEQRAERQRTDDLGAERGEAAPHRQTRRESVGAREGARSTGGEGKAAASETPNVQPPPAAQGEKIPKCFISYSYDSTEHQQWVLRLATDLQERMGIQVILDQWEIRPGSVITHFMERAVADSDYTIMVCTENYAKKADNAIGGVGYEGNIVTALIFRGEKPGRFVPVLRGDPTKSMPTYLLSKNYVDFRDDTRFEEKLEDLARHIHQKYKLVPPKIGKPPF